MKDMATNVDEDLADAGREFANAARMAAMGVVMAKRARVEGEHQQLASELQCPGGPARNIGPERSRRRHRALAPQCGTERVPGRQIAALRVLQALLSARPGSVSGLGTPAHGF